MKKPLLLNLIFCLLLTAPALAENFNLTSFYPTPIGNYQTIRLYPQPALAKNNCVLGSLYSNATDNSLPYFCSISASSGLPEFAPVAGPWTLNVNDIYLTDTSTPDNKKVGIGTTNPTFKLTIDNDGGILANGVASTSSNLPVSGAGTRLMWYPQKGAFRVGFVDGTQWDDANIGTNSVAMGYGNTAASTGATIWGGQNNSAGGGSAPFAPMIAGGKSNNATSELAQILGGEGNSAGYATRISGKNSNCSAPFTMIGGGEGNGIFDSIGTISGGHSNFTAYAGVISGGENNINWGSYATISGGKNNTNLAYDYSTIAGGTSNILSGNYNVISAGNVSNAGGNFSVIAGGSSNSTQADYATVSGGSNNMASGLFSSIGGGDSNIASGQNSTVLAGQTNTASGNNSIIVGGSNNTAQGAYSLAAGYKMTVTGDHSFLWGYSNSGTTVAASDVFAIYNSRMGIRDTDPAALLEINGNASIDDYFNLSTQGHHGDKLTIKNNGQIGVGVANPTNPLQFINGAYVSPAGVFVDASSRAYKENITDIDLAQALEAVTHLTPIQYNYKNEKDHAYLGFIAEDVPALVAEKSREGLSPLEMTAILTKVVSHQQDMIQEQKNETENLLKEVSLLKYKIQHRTQVK